MNSLVLSLIPLLVITSFLSINNPQSTVFAEDTAEYTNCSKSITCGSVESNISYPFWGLNRAEYCGKSELLVTCSGSVPVFTMESITFRLLSMDTSTGAGTPTVKVARQDYWGDICPSNYTDTKLNFSLFDYASGAQNVTFYYGCSAATNPFLGAAAGVSTSYKTCSNGDTVSFLTETQVSELPATGAPDPVTSGTCKESVLVPVSDAAAEKLDKNETSTIQTAINGGFDLDVQNVAATASSCSSCVESGGVCGRNTTTGDFSCYCATLTTSSTCSGAAAPSSSGHIGTHIGILVGVSGAILIVLCIIYMLRKRMITLFKNNQGSELDIEAFIQAYGSIAPKRYSYPDVVNMTNSFEDQIGKGGYGTVYKGKLPDGSLVAVKVLSELKGDGEEFINEVASIGRTSHVNVVTLSGFCYQRNKKALIYEYMPNGSLDKYIHNQGSFKANCHLQWNVLSEIAVGVARGLEYLHRGCNTRILHFDIKPQNILLDKDFCPKISDFGLAKLCKTKESIVSMLGTRGTAGYIAPEVFSRNFGGVSHKSDVYSYGMLVLEMVGARRNLHCEVSRTSETFPHYVYKDLELDNDESIFRAMPQEENEIVRKMMLISLACIQTIPSDRPSMSKVVEMLEGPLHSLTVPPKPLLFPPTRLTINEHSGYDDEESMITSEDTEAR